MSKEHEQLCWDCQNAYAHKCCWFKDYTPVENWTATPCKIKSFENVYIDTYHISNCPNFVKDLPTKLYKGTSEHYKKLNEQLLSQRKQEKKLTNFERLPLVCANFGISLNQLFGNGNYKDIGMDWND